MSIRVMSLVWETDLPPSEKLVLLVIADHADDEGGNAFPSVRRVARRASMSERSVQRILRRLCDCGLVEIEENKGGTWDYRSDRRPNRYRIVGVTGLSPRGGDGVTPEVARGDNLGARGDTEGTDGVTVVSPNTSIELSIEQSNNKAYALCDLLADSWVAAGKGRVKRPRVTESWLVEMDRLMRIDGHDAELVESVIRWVSTSSFWAVNVGSPQKLRKHFDRLLMEQTRDASTSRFAGIQDFLRGM